MSGLVALIDAGGANLASVRYALERLDADVRLVRDADELAGCERVILPGVGAAAAAMRQLDARGLGKALRESELPLLGICLGMQLLYEGSGEGDVECLGLLEGRVRRLQPAEGVRVPHMGWNQLEDLREDPLLDGIEEGAQAYFVHGYAASPGTDSIASCRHGERFAAVVRRGRVLGMQFHPERSGATGARLLGNFL
ncbi:MAG: imidazole glycerol phosphate synthase subunit HisH, partial [Arenimonas sp.]